MAVASRVYSEAVQCAVQEWIGLPDVVSSSHLPMLVVSLIINLIITALMPIICRLSRSWRKSTSR